MPKTIIVVPAYNEAARLPLSAFTHYVNEHLHVQFIFVDDGSTDSTAKLLNQLCRVRPKQFSLLQITENVGKAEAVRRGLLQALAESPKYVAFWDADLATPLEAIDEMEALLDVNSSLQAVFGARVRLLGFNIERRVHRHFLGRLFAIAASLALRTTVYDTQCGAKVFRATELVGLIFGRPFLSRWIFDVEVIARYAVVYSTGPLSAVIQEFPLPSWTDKPDSKVRLRSYFMAVFELIAIFYRYGIKDGYPELHRAPPVTTSSRNHDVA